MRSSSHPSDVKVWKTCADFYDEFTTGEQYGLQSSAVPDLVVARGQLAMWRGEVWADDPRIIGGLDAMVAAALIDEARKNEILGIEE